MKKLLLLAMTVVLGGCGSSQLENLWNSRLGSYTYEDAVLAYGPSTKKEVLSSGKISAIWIKNSPTRTTPTRNLYTGDIMGYRTTGGSETLTLTFSAENAAFMGVRYASDGEAAQLESRAVSPSEWDRLMKGEPNIGGVEPNSPAKKAGILAGDTVLQIGEKNISDYNDLAASIDSYKPNDTAKMRLKRDGKEIELNITFGKKDSVLTSWRIE